MNGSPKLAVLRSWYLLLRSALLLLHHPSLCRSRRRLASSDSDEDHEESREKEVFRRNAVPKDSASCLVSSSPPAPPCFFFLLFFFPSAVSIIAQMAQKMGDDPAIPRAVVEEATVFRTGRKKNDCRNGSRQFSYRSCIPTRLIPLSRRLLNSPVR